MPMMKFVELTGVNAVSGAHGSIVVNFHYVIKMQRVEDDMTLLSIMLPKSWPESLLVLESIEKIGAAMMFPAWCVSAVGEPS